LNRKLSDWASIAEIVSGIAIVVTLIVLLVEVRGNTEAVQAATYQEVSSSIVTALGYRVTDPDVARIWLAGSSGERLELLDQSRYEALVTLNMRHFENAFYQYQIGGIEESQWQPIENIISLNVSSPGHLQWWSSVRSNYSMGFQELVDSLTRSDN